MQLPGILHLYLISTINNCVVIIGDEVGGDGALWEKKGGYEDKVSK